MSRTAKKSYLQEQQETTTWHLENQCQQWNAAFPVGTKVRYFLVVCEDLKFTDTTTRSEAWVMSGHNLVVMLVGVSGCVACEHIRIRIEPTLATPVPEGPEEPAP